MRKYTILLFFCLLPAILNAGTKVGNMNMKQPGILDTDNYIQGLKGIKICEEFSELTNVIIRGELSATTMKYNEVSASGGELIIAPATTLVVDAGSIISFRGDYVVKDGNYLSESATNIGCRDPVFSVGQIVLLKTIAEGTEYMRIKDTGTYTSISTNTVPSGYYYIYEVDRDLDGSGPDSFLHGTAIVSTGKTGEGYIVHDADGPNTPRTDYIVRDGTDTYDNISRKAVIGNLGIVNSPTFGQLSGYGLWTDNGYFEGTIHIKSGSDLVYATPQTSYLHVLPSEFQPFKEYGYDIVQYGFIDDGNNGVYISSAGAVSAILFAAIHFPNACTVRDVTGYWTIWTDTPTLSSCKIYRQPFHGSEIETWDISPAEDESGNKVTVTDSTDHTINNLTYAYFAYLTINKQAGIQPQDRDYFQGILIKYDVIRPLE